MKSKTAASILSALAHETRLDVFRLLVRAGQSGLPAGMIARRLKLSAPTCSFHLKEMRNANLLTRDRQGQSLVYGVNAKAMGGLLAFLMENCCADENSNKQARDPEVGS